MIFFDVFHVDFHDDFHDNFSWWFFIFSFTMIFMMIFTMTFTMIFMMIFHDDFYNDFHDNFHRLNEQRRHRKSRILWLIRATTFDKKHHEFLSCYRNMNILLYNSLNRFIFTTHSRITIRIEFHISFFFSSFTISSKFNSTQNQWKRKFFALDQKKY